MARLSAPSFPRVARRRGTTLVELLIVLVLMALLAAIVIPAFGARGDRLAARRAAAEVGGAFSTAREIALARAAPAAVLLDSIGPAVTVRVGAETLLRRMPLADGVLMRTTRDSMAYAPDGLGIGAANLTVVLRRGAAAETVAVSRLGRARWW